MGSVGARLAELAGLVLDTAISLEAHRWTPAMRERLAERLSGALGRQRRALGLWKRPLRARTSPCCHARRKPTPLQTARWNAVQKAKRRGLSIRGVARELGIHRDTAKKYMEALSPPMKRDRVE